MALVDTENNTLENRYETIRDLAGGLNTLTAPTDKLDQLIERADQWVFSKTGRDSWTTADEKWPLIISASNYRAAAELLDSLPVEGAWQNASSKRKEADRLIATTVELDPAQNKFNFVAMGTNLTDAFDAYKYTEPGTCGEGVGNT